jgi:hypothetical protein
MSLPATNRFGALSTISARNGMKYGLPPSPDDIMYLRLNEIEYNHKGPLVSTSRVCVSIEVRQRTLDTCRPMPPSGAYRHCSRLVPRRQGKVRPSCTSVCHTTASRVAVCATACIHQHRRRVCCLANKATCLVHVWCLQPHNSVQDSAPRRSETRDWSPPRAGERTSHMP